MEPELPLFVEQMRASLAHVLLKVVAPGVLLDKDTVGQLSLVFAVLLLSNALCRQRAPDLIPPADEGLGQLALVTAHLVLGWGDDCRLLCYFLLLLVGISLAHV